MGSFLRAGASHGREGDRGGRTLDVAVAVASVSALCCVSLGVGYALGRRRRRLLGDSQAIDDGGGAERAAPTWWQTSTLGRLMTSIVEGRPVRIEGADTIQMVIIVHRHGARLPNKCFPRDLSWPKNPEFYENYRGHLTPVGCQMLLDVGRSLKERYVEGSDLFKGVSANSLHKHVVAYTSNMQRTLFSAWSFLYGMFPQTPQYFSFATDRLKVDLKAVRRNLAEQGKTMGIPIYIEEVPKTDRLFHQYKMNSELTLWQEANVKCSPVLREASKDPLYPGLISKLYRMTRLPALNPNTSSYFERMTAMKRVQTQINIARSHGLPLLPNKEGLFLSNPELDMIRKLANEIWKLLYRPALSNEKADSMGHNAASHLAHYVTQLMVDRAEGKNKLRVAAYSAHDTTILALAARLGIDIEPPEFGGYFLFELHRDKADPDTPYVKFLYNRDPCTLRINDLSARKMDFSHKIRTLADLPEGTFALHKMVAECQTNGMRKSTRILRKLSKIRKPRMKSEEMQNHVLSMMSELLRGEYKMVFDMWDRVGKGVITVEDLGSAMRLMGKNPSKLHLVQLIELVDSDNDGMLDFKDFLRMMTLCDLKDLKDDEAESHSDHEDDALSVGSQDHPEGGSPERERADGSSGRLRRVASMPDRDLRGIAEAAGEGALRESSAATAAVRGDGALTERFGTGPHRGRRARGSSTLEVQEPTKEVHWEEGILAEPKPRRASIERSRSEAQVRQRQGGARAPMSPGIGRLRMGDSFGDLSETGSVVSEAELAECYRFVAEDEEDVDIGEEEDDGEFPVMEGAG